MISPSEVPPDQGAGTPLPGMPERPIGGARKRMDVARLEFYGLGEPGAAPAQSVDTVQALSADEVYTQEQVEELTQQLRRQQLDFEAELERVRIEARTESQQREAEFNESVEAERARLTRVCEEFAKQRKRYFIEVEAEVVRLALAIAARILHREAKLDPLLLTAAVRVVLEKIADNSTMELRVPVAELERWKVALAGEAKSRLTVVADERLEAGDCILETSVGKVELGVSAQLEEIEKGFFDLLEQRPA